MKRNNLYNRGIQLLTILAIFGAITGVYLFLATLPPPPTTPENIAYLFYLDGNHEQVVEILRPIVKENPDNLEASHLFALALLKMQSRLEAEKIFKRLYAKNPKNEDFQLGLAETELALRHYDEALPLFEGLVNDHPKNGKYHLFLGEAYYKAGENEKASQTFQYMIDHGLEKKKAHEALLALYGFSKKETDQQFVIPQKEQKSKEIQVQFKTEKDFIAYKNGEEWCPVFLKGLNLSAAAPGYYVSNPPREFEVFESWLEKIADMHCNVVRLYTLASPAFYQALLAHNERSENKLWLFQEVWLHVREPRYQSVEEAFDLFDPSWEEEFLHDIMNVVDALHGKANLKKSRRTTGGIYTADISQYVVGIGLGKEVETYIADETNRANPSITSYQGEYVSIDEGNATEVWFAKMCDFTAYYEMLHYHAQHPLTIVNAPQFDPMDHPSEASFEEQNAWEKRYGIQPFEFQRIGFQNDIVDLDIQKFSVSDRFPAGLFACYHSYPHWPDFMWADWKYQIAKDKRGEPNPFYGHIVELKEHHQNFPLVMGEYGVSTSWYSVYNTIDSINQGGYSDRSQAKIITEWTQDLFETKYAGAIVFEFQDEWWHRSVNLVDFQEPVSTPLWFNVVDAEANYGVETYHAPPPIPLLNGDKQLWKNAQKLFSSSFFKKQEIKNVYVTSDFAFLYIRLDVSDFEHNDYSIALSTYPGKVGSQTLSEIDLHLKEGANFLVRLQKKKGELLIAKNYNPHVWKEADPLVGGQTLVQNTGPFWGLEENVAFEEILIPTQPYHIGRDGTIFPEMHTNMSELRYGTADPASPDFCSLAAWHVDKQKGMIELRIPWMLLYVIDPPDRGILYDIIPGRRDFFRSQIERTPGISFTVLAVNTDGEVESADVPLYTWKKWNTIPAYDTRQKQSYFSLQKLFKILNF